MKFKREWILNPPAQCAAACMRLLDSLFFWMGERIEASKRRRGIVAIAKSTGAAPREETARTVPEMPNEYPGTIQSLNLTRRARAMHMRRRGDEPHTIAAALGVPPGEIELLFKLDRIIQQRG
jgi:hypothetical protein